MYEEQEYNVIMDRILARVPDTLDKRESSFMYNAVAPIAVELQNMYIALDNILNITFFDTSDREGKYQRCKERGIDTSQFDATKTIAELHTTPITLDIPIGTRFNYGEVNFDVIEKITDGVYYVECDTPGVIGNVTGEVTPVDYIDGLETCEIVSIYQWGEDDADIEQIDEVYYSSLNSQAFGGNRADYLAKMKAIPGIGGVKVYSASEWLGGGTCKLVFSTSSHTKPASDFVDSIQTMIDPLQNQGAGYGIAPIGHIVTVAGCDETTVDVDMQLTLQPGYDWIDVENAIQAVIDKYLTDLNEDWDNMDNLVVRISQMETRILDVEGVIDITGVTLNGVASNMTVDKDSLVKRGTVHGTT